jgi:fumarylacetoacetase
MLFGFVLLNDWSARDIQAWEYQPLGPFQAKSFATSISPWIVTRDALEPFRVPTPAPEKPLLPYLRDSAPHSFLIELEARLTPADGEDVVLCRTNYRHMYYSFAQQLAHHSVSGCAMCTGDLLGSGTISGPDAHSRGCLLELTWGGKEPLTLPGAIGRRTFLEDGDRITLTGWCQGDGYRIGFGDCTGKVLPAPHEPEWAEVP